MLSCPPLSGGLIATGGLYQKGAKTMKFLLMDSGILGFGVRNTAQGIRNRTTD